MAKRTTTSRKTTKTRARKPSGATRSRKQQQLELPFELRPEHQREIFALGLIGIAAITIFFYVTGASGWIGKPWVEMTQRLLGWGSVVVPLGLGLLGISILWREHYQDLKFSGVTVLGTVVLLIALQMLLEFSLSVPRNYASDSLGEGGGLVGFYLLRGMSDMIGRAPSFIVVCLLGLVGVILTFNITLYDLWAGVRDGFVRFWHVLWNPPERERYEDEEDEELEPAPRSLPARRAARPAELPFVPPPGADGQSEDLVATPIAARPTRASLFKRPESKAQAERKAAEAPNNEDRPAKGQPARPSPDALLAGLLNMPAGNGQAKPSATPVPVEPNTETVQAPLDGFEVPAVYHAWPLPAPTLLDRYESGTITDDERKLKSRLIEETLASFKVEAQVVGVNTGPAVTQFELQPAIGVKVSKITTLEKDLALALAAPSIRIEAPIPGKNVVGIEIPNSSTSIVGLRDVIDSDEFDRSKHKLRMPLGEDVSGRSVVVGMERMPHLLVAGSTGSGKSVAVNAFICALLLKHTPEELKFIMVDPKMVELIVYNHIPHLLSPVVTELERVVPTLKWAVREMERRYKVFAKHGFRNIDSYKQAARHRADLEPMPYIVIIIDELADLMMMAPDEVETMICRLAQMARATGMHLIIATQRPSVDVVTGLIKANFPSRIAFAVTSQIDSRVILDTNGAEQLLGRGDMLYLGGDSAKPVRIQGTYVSDHEVERIVNFWRIAKPPELAPAGTTPGANGANGNGAHGHGEQNGDGAAAPAAAPAPPALKGPAEFLSVEEQDELLPAAIKLVQHHTRASASLLQRRLRIGYSKAAQLIDLLEQQGYVGPAEEGRSREVLRREQVEK
ncbi:MAG TPA: DNA translocase FtsK [Roseiflexaceae bacterium]|nr:DNA translocase FtsK [Roseiflexaceae bacterium]